MGIKPTFTQEQFNKALERKVQLIKMAIIARLKFLGERCLIEARTSRTYRDQTGNLTNSMGYVVTDHGRIVTTAGFENQEGGAIGKAFANTLATKNADSFALYVVAGMNYAAYVEAKGYNVLSSSELLAERELPRMMRQLKNNIGT